MSANQAHYTEMQEWNRLLFNQKLSKKLMEGDLLDRLPKDRLILNAVMPFFDWLSKEESTAIKLFGGSLGEPSARIEKAEIDRIISHEATVGESRTASAYTQCSFQGMSGIVIGAITSMHCLVSLTQDGALQIVFERHLRETLN